MLKIKKTNNYLTCITLLISFLLSTPIKASSYVDQEVSPADKPRIFEKLKGLTRDIDSITAIVTQEKQVSLLKEKIRIDGTVIMKKPNMFRWDIVNPEESIIAIDGETMTIYHPDTKEAQVYNLSGSLIARNTVRFLTMTMWGSLTEIERNFTMDILRQEDEIIFELEPISKIISRYLSSIVIYYDEETGFPRGFEIITPKGDKTISKLSNIKINPEIKTGTFKIKLPEDVRITNKFEPSRCITE
jgi:outer membrane lipoprotein carrier protein